MNLNTIYNKSIRHQQYEYDVIGKLGSGGMGKIFLAIQNGPLNTRKKVVLKVPHSERTGKALRNDLENEARVSTMMEHPNIVRTINWMEIDGTPCMVSEYVAGYNLNEVVRFQNSKNKRVPNHIAAQIMLQTCAAVRYIHDAKTGDGEPLNIIHRDLDLSNVMLAEDGFIKVIDFGVAKSKMQEAFTKPGTYKGRLVNLPPDVFEVKEIDQRTDVFLLGVMFFELLTGRRARTFTPYDTLATIVEHIRTTPIPAPSSVAAGIPRALDNIVQQATALNREDRYLSVVGMINDIRRLGKHRILNPDPAYLEKWLKADFGPLKEIREARLQRMKIHAEMLANETTWVKERKREKTILTPLSGSFGHSCRTALASFFKNLRPKIFNLKSTPVRARRFAHLLGIHLAIIFGAVNLAASDTAIHRDISCCEKVGAKMSLLQPIAPLELARVDALGDERNYQRVRILPAIPLSENELKRVGWGEANSHGPGGAKPLNLPDEDASLSAETK